MSRTAASLTRSTGHTLLEVVTAMTAGSMLLAGLGSVMFIAREVAYTSTAATDRVVAAHVVGKLASELRNAHFVLDRSAHAIEFVIADRDGDGGHERLRYEWSGQAGDPLLRSANQGEAFTILDSVEMFQLDYQPEPSVQTVPTTVDTGEQLLYSYSVISSSNEREITASDWLAQRLDPQLVAVSPPDDATHWKPTRIEFQVKEGGEPSGQLAIQLREAAGSDQSPTSRILVEQLLAASSLPNNFSWKNVDFPQPLPLLALHRPYCLTWTGAGVGPSGTAAAIRSDTDASSGVLASDDAGASWSSLSPREVYYRVFGKYSSPGPDQSVTRHHLNRVTIAIQLGQHERSRLDAGFQLVNRPELLSAFWRADFQTDPTQHDVDADGSLDWQTEDGNDFDISTLVEGIWHADAPLTAAPSHDFATVTTIDARWRAGSLSTAAVMITADWSDNGNHVDLTIRLAGESDGTQTLQIQAEDETDGVVTIFEQPNLPDDFHRFRLTIVPAHDLVQVHLNDVDLGSVAYPVTGSQSARLLSVLPLTGSPQIDYIAIGVAE